MSIVQIVFYYTHGMAVCTLRHGHVRDTSVARRHLVHQVPYGNGARWLTDRSGASQRSCHRGGSKLYYVTLHWAGSPA